MKKKFVVFGNCQAGGIANFMLTSPSFANRYEYMATKPVQTIKNKHLEDWKTAISESDLIVYQKISESYKFPSVSESNMLKIAKPESIKISFPSLFFNAYFPQLGGNLYNQNKNISLLDQVDDYLWLGLYAKGYSHQQTKEIVMNPDLFSKEEAQHFYEMSISELQKREQFLQVTASDIYAALYQNVKLGYQFNHPTRVLTVKVVNRILALLQEDLVEESSEKIRRKNPNLVTAGIYPSLYYGLGLEFEEDFELYNTTEGPHTLSFLLEKMWRFYQNNYTKEEILQFIGAKKPWILSKLESIAS
jgi:Polysaccharide biosynthesis enzyme WcbI